MQSVPLKRNSRTAMTVAAPSTYTTTALINNIHCASCVSYIKDVFASFGLAVQSLDVNILSHEVRIVHQSYLSASDICRALLNAAFEVHSVTTLGASGEKLQEFSLATNPQGWFELAAGKWAGPSNGTSLSRLSRLDYQPRNQEQRHLENCTACQQEGWDLEKQGDLALAQTSSGKSSGFYAAGEQARGVKKPVKIHDQGALSQHIPPFTRNEQENREKTLSHRSTERSRSRRLTLSIGGMTCTACSASVTQTLEKLTFVNGVNVNLMNNSASVSYTGPKELSSQVVTAVEDLGYDASIVEDDSSSTANSDVHTSAQPPSSLLHEAVLSISGMTCAACTNAIESGLRELPFVKSVVVNLMTNSATVTFADDNLQKIIQVVEDHGFECGVERCSPLDSSEEGTRLANEAHQRTVLLRVKGMFCQRCPSRVIDAIKREFPGLVSIDRLPSLDDPILSITYTPQPPHFTIRTISNMINSLHESFVTTIHHAPSIEERSQEIRIHEQRCLLKRLLLSFIIAIPTFLIGVLWMSLVPRSNKIRVFFERPVWAGAVSRAQWALFILATPVFFFAADIFHLRAIKEIRALWRKGSKVSFWRRFYRFGSMNLLMSAGTSVAYFSSLALLLVAAKSKHEMDHKSTYFDTVVFLTFFILGGRCLEAYSKSKTGNAVGMLSNLRPEEAILVDAVSGKRASQDSEDSNISSMLENDSHRRVKTDFLEVGDTIIVPYGSSPSADGMIMNGSSKFDESSLTGESHSVVKNVGDKVYTGTINVGDPITVVITEIGGASTLDQIISVVRQGQTKRAPVERVVDSVTGFFVPIITALAILTFVVWFSLGQSGVLSRRYLDSEQGGWAFWSLQFAIAVFVVACPCGIGLAAPTALFVGGGLAAKKGILVRGGGEAFQEASNVDLVVFDKTGTLTQGGNLQVTDYEMIATGEEAEIAWAVAKSLEESSSHPIAQAVLHFASTRSPLRAESLSMSEEPGRGLRGTFTITPSNSSNPSTYDAAIGSEAFISALLPAPEALTYFTTNILSLWKSQSKSIALLAMRPTTTAPTTPSSPWTLTALFGVSDPIRPSAQPTIAALQSRNIPVYMLTGDNPTTAAAVAATLSIPLDHVFAGVLPADKAAKIQHLQAHGPRRRRRRQSSRSTATVAFVGDGINDAPALATATVSISLASASAIAHSSSSFILLRPSLAAVIPLLDLSRRVFRRVRFNFAWALVYNAVLVPVAAGALFWTRDAGWRLGPVWASVAMAASSVSVVASSLALRWEGKEGGRGVGDGE